MNKMWLFAAVGLLAAWALVGCGSSLHGPASLPVGHTETTEKHLQRPSQLVKADIELSRAALENPQKQVVANRRCPITGVVIRPAKATDSFVREYKGQNVAFCSPSCPQAWDMLTNTGKDATLREVKTSKERALKGSASVLGREAWTYMVEQAERDNRKFRPQPGPARHEVLIVA